MYHKAVDIWYQFYQLKKNTRYVFDGKDGRHLKQLLKKVEYKVLEAGIEADEGSILNSLTGYLHSIEDKWVLENLDISLVNSKFNILYAAAVKRNPFNTKSRIDEAFERKFGDSTSKSA